MIIEKFKSLLREMIATQIPDIHLVSLSAPYIRKHNGEIEYMNKFGELSKDDMKEIITEMLGGEKEFQNFTFSLEQDFSYSIDEAKFRVNIFHDAKGYSTAIRYIPIEIPSLETLNISKEVRQLLHKGKGLILVTGPTGSGKSTTLASMVNYINSNFKKHIITIEDPIEFNLKNDKCLISQREVGTHSKSFLRAIKSALREDPDVIVVGEMRDPETIQAALTLAETGHLVLSTLHTNDTVQSVDRIVDSFPSSAQSQIRTQLAMSLNGVVSQILLPKKETGNRVVCREILLNNDAVRNLIIHGNTHQLYSIIELSGQEGMILMDKYLQMLLQKGLITKEVFNSHIRDRDLATN
ncbi:MAG: PilT/PilU family type 4a pilus ATPase [Candidatus Gracilibacteria bacterium]|nr:PilT/PilU family type 4a pilus ATPase [Candidatus Gracilibacteria bacterium]MDD2909121.1 PilT/PilU family type 4a pilus ATPase [Candidatus Gracilibacteria bacterium]